MAETPALEPPQPLEPFAEEASSKGRLSLLGEHLRVDLGAAPRSGPFQFFVAVVAAASLVGVLVRGPGHLVSVAVILLLCAGLALVAWWCGEHPRAHRQPDRLLDPAPLLRTWLPFVPLFVAIGAPKLYVAGAAIVGGLPLGLASGIVQQLIMQLGVTAPLEAFSRRRDFGAVSSALIFGLAHTGVNLPLAGGDPLLAAANALVAQAPIGLVAAFAYQRHRAPVALGAVHGLTIA